MGFDNTVKSGCPLRTFWATRLKAKFGFLRRTNRLGSFNIPQPVWLVRIPATSMFGKFKPTVPETMGSNRERSHGAHCWFHQTASGIGIGVWHWSLLKLIPPNRHWNGLLPIGSQAKSHSTSIRFAKRFCSLKSNRVHATSLSSFNANSVFHIHRSYFGRCSLSIFFHRT